jgi:hypothetical protein
VSFSVLYHHEALPEFNALGARERKGVLTIVAILAQIGPKITEPHAKHLAGGGGLWELRPGGGKVLARPLYARASGGSYVVLAVAPESVTDPRGFTNAVARARRRAPDVGIKLG